MRTVMRAGRGYPRFTIRMSPTSPEELRLLVMTACGRQHNNRLADDLHGVTSSGAASGLLLHCLGPETT